MGSETQNTKQEVLAAAVFALDALREALGVSLPDLAFRADMDAEHLWAIVNGAPTTPAEAARLSFELWHLLVCLDAEAAASVA